MKFYFAKEGARGFTLLETLVAVTILTLAVAGPLYVAGRALAAARVARDQLTASYLAQEGIEYVRSMRDREFLYTYPPGNADDAWNAFLYGGGSGQGSIVDCEVRACSLDPSLPMGSGNSIRACGNYCTPLYLTADGRYTQSNSGTSPTPFTRTIQATILSATDLKVVSIVTWSTHDTPYSVTVIDNLTPWQ